jgi:hypothetical protein
MEMDLNPVLRDILYITAVETMATRAWWFVVKAPIVTARPDKIMLQLTAVCFLLRFCLTTLTTGTLCMFRSGSLFDQNHTDHPWHSCEHSTGLPQKGCQKAAYGSVKLSHALTLIEGRVPIWCH